MSDPDRYVEPPLTLESRRRAPRPRGPAPVTLIVSLVLLVLVAGGVFFMYRSGVRTSGQAPQPLGAPLGDVRAPAPPQPPTPDATAGLTISRDDPNATAAPPTLAPPPESPLPEAGPSTTGASAANPSTPPSPPAKPQEKPDAIDRLIADATKQKATLTKAPPAATDAAPTKDLGGKDLGGSAVVQIGAFSSQALADKEWSKAAAVAPGAMAGKGKRVIPVEKDGGTLYRTAITGFASREQAQSLCDRLQAAGGNCFVR